MRLIGAWFEVVAVVRSAEALRHLKNRNFAAREEFHSAADSSGLKPVGMTTFR
jgi:hypothetical protein